MKSKSRYDREPRGFWERETCEYCGGPIVEKIIDLPRRVGNKYVLIKRVHAGVCKQCGSRYFAANVLKTIEELLKSRRKPKRQISMSVYSL